MTTLAATSLVRDTGGSARSLDGKPVAMSIAAWREVGIQAWRPVSYSVGPGPSKILEVKKNLRAK